MTQNTTARSTWWRIAISLPLFSFPVFINKSARKKNAVVDRTNLSPKFPLAPHRTSSRSNPDPGPFRAPPRLTDPAPDPLVARQDLSFGTSFAPSLWFHRLPVLGFAGVGFGPRSARLRMDSALGRRFYACPVGFTSDYCDFSR